RKLAAAWSAWLRLMDPQALESLRRHLDDLQVTPGFGQAAFDAAALGYEAIRDGGDADDGAAQAATIHANLVRQLGGPPLRDDQVQDDYIQVDDIQDVERYLFVAKHELRGPAAKREHFAAHPEILAGVYRMFGVTGYGKIRDSDVMLLRHELYEMKLKLVPGTTHDKAHAAAHKKYPWAEMVGLNGSDGQGHDKSKYYGAFHDSGTPEWDADYIRAMLDFANTEVVPSSSQQSSSQHEPKQVREQVREQVPDQEQEQPTEPPPLPPRRKHRRIIWQPV